MVPAVVAVAAFLVVLSAAQGLVRAVVQEIWQTAWIPYSVRTFTYFGFIFSFASVRLRGSLTILVLALRRSYRRQEGSTALPAE